MKKGNPIRRFNPALKLARHSRFGEYCDGKTVFPINVEISPTGRCNAKCSWCFYDEFKDPDFFVDFDKARLRELMHELSGLDVKSITWTGGGEPTLHPDFGELVELAHSLEIDQGLFTNGLRRMEADPGKLDWIRVSKTDKDWKANNLKYLRGSKTLGLCLNYLGNDEDVETALRVGEIAKVNYVQVRPALEKNGLLTETRMPGVEHPLLACTDYKFAEAGKKRPYQKCEGHHFIPFVWQNGNVDVCGYHWADPRFNLGNLSNRSFKGIMKDAPRSVEVVSDCQTCCKLNEINILIHEQEGLEDKNFP